MQFFKNIYNNLVLIISNKIKNNKYMILSIFLIIMLLFYFSRAYFYPNVNFLRVHTPEFITFYFLLFIVSFSVIYLFKEIKKIYKILLSLLLLFSIIVATIIVITFNEDNEKNIFYMLNKQQTFNQIRSIELQELPLTKFERIYPYETILKIAKDKISSSEYTVENFELVYNKDKESLTWNAEKTPLGKINKLATNVNGVVSIEIDKDVVDKKEFNVSFNYGRKLSWFNSLDYILPKHLSLFDYFDKTIDDNVRLIQKENGEWVQVVAVINWEGIWPSVYPKFHGVYVIEQISDKYNNVSFLNTDLKIPISNPNINFLTPKEIEKTSYLKNQNLVPEEITKHYASSWAFKNGIWNYLVTKKDLTKISDNEEDNSSNKQPFTIWFEDITFEKAKHSGLFQFYALEPIGENKALSEILLFDSHGYTTDVLVFNYNLFKNKKNLLGSQRIMETIKDSDKHIDWSSFKVTESRPFIRDVKGVRKFYFFNSVISKTVASAKPTVVITDPDTLDVYWFNGNDINKQIEDFFNKLN